MVQPTDFLNGALILNMITIAYNRILVAWNHGPYFTNSF